MTNSGYQVAGEDIVFEEFDDDLVILNLATGQYFGLNETARHTWEALMSGMAPRLLGEHAPLNDTLDAFVQRLLEFGLVVSDENATKPVDEKISAALAGCSAAPQIEVYDDLSDLILADPIHDVEAEVGWPKMPGAN